MPPLTPRTSSSRDKTSKSLYGLLIIVPFAVLAVIVLGLAYRHQWRKKKEAAASDEAQKARDNENVEKERRRRERRERRERGGYSEIEEAPPSYDVSVGEGERVGNACGREGAGDALARRDEGGR